MWSRRLLRLLLAVGLLAAAAVPVAAETDVVGAATCRALTWLATQQGPDGSFGFRPATGAYQPSASTTADAVYVLARLGEDPDGSAWTRGGNSALAALAALAPAYVGTDAGQAGKVARAVAAAGADPRDFAGMDLVAIIQAAYDPATGRFHPALLFRHTLAVEGLMRSGVPVPPAALDALLNAQLSDGGWFWSFDGQQSDVDTTGRVLQLLAADMAFSAPQAYARAAGLLEQLQTAAGGWGVGPAGAPNGNSTALAVSGLTAAGFDLSGPQFQKQGLSPLDALLSFQEDTGAFVYLQEPGKEEVRLMATLDALSALAFLVVGPLPCSHEALPAVKLEPGVRAADSWRTPPGLYLPMILVF